MTEEPANRAGAEDRRVMKIGRRAEDLYVKWNVRVRDTVIFLVGVMGVVNEVFFVAVPRPSILIFLGSLIGVPFVLNADEKRASEKRESDDS